MNKIVGGTGIVGIAQAVVSLSLFLLLPLLTKNLSPYEYGIWSLILALIGLASIIQRQGLDNAINRFLPSITDEEGVKNAYITAVSIAFIMIVLTFTIAFLLSSQITTLIFQNESLRIIVLFAFVVAGLHTFLVINDNFFRYQGKFSRYSAITVLNSLLILGFSALFLNNGLGLFSPVYAYLCSHIVSLSISFTLIFKDIGIGRVDLCMARDFLRFGTPLSPSEATQWITQSSDRYMIGFLAGVSAAGVYSAGYTVSAIIAIIVFPIQFVILPLLSKMYDRGDNEQVEKYISGAINIYLVLAIPAVIGISVLSEPIMVVLSSPEYIDGRWVIFPVSLGLMFYGVFTLIMNSSYLLKKTGNFFKFNTIAAFINIVLNLILISLIGIIGAAIATTISYFTMMLIAIIWTRERLSISLDYLLILKVVLTTSIMSAILFYFKDNDPLILAITLLSGPIIYFLILYLLIGQDYRKKIRGLFLS